MRYETNQKVQSVSANQEYLNHSPISLILSNWTCISFSLLLLIDGEFDGEISVIQALRMAAGDDEAQ